MYRADEFNRAPTKAALLGFLEDFDFTRLWIAQETLLSSRIWVFTPGSIWVPWVTLQDCFLTKSCGTEHAMLKALILPMRCLGSMS